MSGMLVGCVAVTPDADEKATPDEEVGGTLDADIVVVPAGGEFAFEHPNRTIDANKANPNRIECSSKNQRTKRPSGRVLVAATKDNPSRSVLVVNWTSQSSLLRREWPSPQRQWECRVGPTCFGDRPRSS